MAFTTLRRSTVRVVLALSLACTFATPLLTAPTSASASSCPSMQLAALKAALATANGAVRAAEYATSQVPGIEMRLQAARANLVKLTEIASKADAAAKAAPTDAALADAARRAKVTVAAQKAAIKAGEAKIAGARKGLAAALATQKKASAAYNKVYAFCQAAGTTLPASPARS